MNLNKFDIVPCYLNFIQYQCLAGIKYYISVIIYICQANIITLKLDKYLQYEAIFARTIIPSIRYPTVKNTSNKFSFLHLLFVYYNLVACGVQFETIIYRKAEIRRLK